MPKVTVLLSTYNGEKYISEQLDSLLAQQEADVRVLIRDDSSTDNTCRIIESCRAAHPDRITVMSGSHKGFSGSFFSLVREAASSDDSDYYAFCDQDDVWVPDRLQAAISMIDSDSPVPEMYFSNATLTDSKLKPVRPLYDNFSFPPLKSMRLTDNPAAGCTIVFNKKARDCFVLADENKIVYHDFWMYLICSYLGRVVYDDRCGVLYRQHEDNVMGRLDKKKVWINRAKKMKHRLHLREYSASELSRLFGDKIDPSETENINIMAGYRQNLSTRMRLLFHREIVAPSAYKNFWFKLQVILGSA